MDVLRTLIVFAGVGQLALVIASLAIPAVLGWRAETAKLRPLTRQVFWTYAAYIWAINLCFGLLSALAADRLLDGTPLARLVCGFIATYWIARLAVQFLWFDRTDLPSGWLPAVGEVGLVALFAYLAAVYGVCVWWMR